MFLVTKLAFVRSGGFPYDETKCWLGVDHIKRLRHCLVWKSSLCCVDCYSLHVGSSVLFCHAQASLSRQRISCLNSAGAWDRISHTHIFCAFPTVSVSPSPSLGTTPSFFNRQDCTMEAGMHVPPSAPPELVTTSIRGWAGSQESTACLVTGLVFVLSNKACLCEEWGVPI